MKTITEAMIFDGEELEDFENSEICHICLQPLDSDDKAVRDHDHLTGLYRGAAHNRCNLNFNDSYVITIAYHNLAYDLHLFICELVGNKIIPGKTSVIPKTMENFLSITHELQDFPGISFRFIDSLRFLNGSLDALAELLDPSAQLLIC